MTQGSYDLIVIGAGGAGSAVLFHAALRGAKCLGIDRFPPGHDRGSSHGDTRVIRLAYFEHPDYVPLLHRSYALWAELEEMTGLSLYRETGLLQVGPKDGFVLRGVLESARRHGLEVDELTREEAEHRFPAYAIPEGLSAVWEKPAGILRVEMCVVAHATAAVRAGAKLHIGESVLSWEAKDGAVTVTTDADRYTARRLVITAGAWAPQLLSDLGVRFEIRRKPLFWYPSDSIRHEVERGCPIFLYEIPGEGVFYGFPKVDALGVKVAEHSGGRTVADPLCVDRALDPGDAQRVEAFLRKCLPGVRTGAPTRHAVCMYTMTPDEHFVVGTHPAHPEVAVAAGLSGHGFKLTPALGEALADLALQGSTPLPIGFLSPSRPGLSG